MHASCEIIMTILLSTLLSFTIVGIFASIFLFLDWFPQWLIDRKFTRWSKEQRANNDGGVKL